MKFRFGFALLVLLAVLPACRGGETVQAGSESGPEEPSAEEQQEAWTISFGGSNPGSMVGLLTAVIQAEGIDADHDIELEVTEADPAAAEQALVTGQFDAGFVPLLTLARVRAEGVPLRFLMPLQATHASVLVKADSDYETLEDLRGAKVASLGPASGMSTSMEILTAPTGDLAWPEDFEVIQGPATALVAYIDQGQTDAVMHFEPFVTRLMATGDYRLILSQNEAYEEATGDDLILSGIAARDEWIEEDPDRARAFIDMLRAGMEFIQNADASILDPYEEDFGLSGDDLRAAYEAMAPLYTPDPPSSYEQGVVDILNSAVDLELIEGFEQPVFWQGYEQ